MPLLLIGLRGFAGRLVDGGAWSLALVNLGGSLAIGVVAVVAGLTIGRMF